MAPPGALLALTVVLGAAGLKIIGRAVFSPLFRLSKKKPRVSKCPATYSRG